MSLKVANSEILAIVKASPQAFSVGTSGPDFLFYHSKLPWQNQELGSKVRKHWLTYSSRKKLTTGLKSPYQHV